MRGGRVLLPHRSCRSNFEVERRMAFLLCASTLGLQSGVPALRPSRPRPRPVLLAADAARLVEENERLMRHATRLRGVGEEGFKARLQEARAQEAKLEARLREVTLARRALEEEAAAASPQPLARGEPSGLNVAGPAAALKRLQRLQRLQDVCERIQRLEESLLHQKSAITLSAAAAATAATAVAAAAATAATAVATGTAGAPAAAAAEPNEVSLTSS